MSTDRSIGIEISHFPVVKARLVRGAKKHNDILLFDLWTERVVSECLASERCPSVARIGKRKKKKKRKCSAARSGNPCNPVVLKSEWVRVITILFAEVMVALLGWAERVELCRVTGA